MNLWMHAPFIPAILRPVSYADVKAHNSPTAFHNGLWLATHLLYLAVVSTCRYP